MYKTTEIASSDIPSDNPVHQRLLYPYIHVSKLLSGNVLEIGCGTGTDAIWLSEQGFEITAIDAVDLPIKLAKEKVELI